MGKRIATGMAVVLVAFALAAGSAWWTVLRGPVANGIVNGPWRANLSVGSAKADLYTRANVAITGLFALNAAEAIYLSAAFDDGGRPLLARCTYRIVGKPVAAGWWSITAYGDDHFLIPNAANRFSYNMGNLQARDGAPFEIIAAPKQADGNWLPTGDGTNGFHLVMRLYNPAAATVTNIRTIDLPSIRPIGGCS